MIALAWIEQATIFNHLKHIFGEFFEDEYPYQETYIYIYLEPNWPLFLKDNPLKQGLFQAKTRVIWVLGIYHFREKAGKNYRLKKNPGQQSCLCFVLQFGYGQFNDM